MTATDVDSGEAGHVTYYIPPGAPHEPFTVDPSTGDIRTTRRLELYSIPDVFVFQVLAKDAGVPVKYASTMVYIHIDVSTMVYFLIDVS